MNTNAPTDRQIVADLQAAFPADSGPDAEVLRTQLAERAEREGILDVAYRIVDSPIGPLLLATSTEGLVRVAFELEDHDAVLEQLARAVSSRILRSDRRTDDVARQLDEYFSGGRRRFDVPVDLRLVHGFRREVISHLRRHRLRIDGELCRSGEGRRQPGRRPRGGQRVLAQPRAGGDAVPSSDPQRRHDRPVPRWRRSQGGPVVTGGRGMTAAPRATSQSIVERVGALDWPAITGGLDDVGVALTSPVLSVTECQRLIDGYGDDGLFRSTIDMARHRFGQGQYRYFAHPLPDIVTDLRAAFWPHLLPVAREWARRRGQPMAWPESFDDWLDQCHRAGQQRPTPLMLRYGPGDWNALHRDLYGELVFPLQVAIGLDQPDVDYTGGEFVVVEQRPRAQSRATATTIPRWPRVGVHHAGSTDPDAARLVERSDASQRQRRSLRAAPHAWPDLPRRRVNDRCGLTRPSSEPVPAHPDVLGRRSGDRPDPPRPGLRAGQASLAGDGQHCAVGPPHRPVLHREPFPRQR